MLQLDDQLKILHEYIGDDEEVNIPDGIEIIKPFAFSHKHALTSLVIPESTTLIDQQAFENCDHLHDVVIYAKDLEINPMAFFNCSDFRVTGYAGSEVERFCELNYIPFIAMYQGRVNVLFFIFSARNDFYLCIYR